MSGQRIALFILGLAAAGAGHAQWPQFRGPNGSGVGSGAGYPAEFSPSKNVVWKKAVPYGQSSPVVAGGRVYLTASDGDRLLTLCFDAATGSELWRREIRRERAAKGHSANDPASPTPAADEAGVYVFFPDFGLAAYSPEGKERWTLPLGPFKNFYGMAGSPVLAGDLLILVCDQQRGSFIQAVDRATGRPRWKTERPAATVSWATPMVHRPASGAAQLIVLSTNRLDSFYPDTGELRWWMPVGSMGAMGVPVSNGDSLLVSTLGSSEPWISTFAAALEKYDRDKNGRLSGEEFRLDKSLAEHFGWFDDNGSGDVDTVEWNEARQLGSGEQGAFSLQPERLQGKVDPRSVRWRFQKNLPYIPAPLLYDNVYYMVRDGGIITSLDPATGRMLKEGRSREALGQYYASPVAAAGRIFLANADGKVTVLKAGGEWDVLAVNDLSDEIHATPALSGGRVYVRTRGSLFCFGAARDGG